MTVDFEPAELAGALAVAVDVDGSHSLPDLTAAIDTACERVEDRGERTVVVLRLGTTPAGRRSWPGDVRIRDVSRWERALRRLERLAAITIAVAQGTCGGPALEVLLTADFRIVTTDFQLLLPVNDGHVWPGMAVHRLVQQLGAAKARQIVLWGDEIAAERARELGLADQITEDPAEAVHTAAVLMGRISDAELAVRRRLLLEAMSTPFEEALGTHLAACDRELRRLTGDPDDPAEPAGTAAEQQARG
ncbi:enoyl-CoA-hydratase DpgB [Kitasatospora sp. MAP5-34]|uniref:enoyl-CoA-hydratase DpgB n=1 Tax=Kitasatospora sp. MAP5-34 TaxID=3035102 RepID=UPI00247729C0|nr:enoyl-CoA-hydratase DpgB [Kitasatospora sp. MAP5-34]MDH6578565.1 isomerase DpgB [Kitasatospora sp. MAP5-34]